LFDFTGIIAIQETINKEKRERKRRREMVDKKDLPASSKAHDSKRECEVGVGQWTNEAPQPELTGLCR